VTRVHHLNCATMCPLGGFLLGRSGMRGRLVAHCLVIETERDGLVLVDTGLGTRDVDGHTELPRAFRRLVGPTLDPAEPAVAQLVGLGYRAEDVRHIVVTHLDVDHAGGIGDFPHAKIHVHAREHAAAMARATLGERERYVPAQWAHGPSWEVYSEDGDTWRGLPAITRLRGVDAEIGLIPLHGHSRGHSGVLVHAGDRWLIHAGDAYFHRNALAGTGTPLGFALFERVVQVDGAARRASLGALRQLRHNYDDVIVFSAHDPIELDTQRARAAETAATAADVAKSM